VAKTPERFRRFFSFESWIYRDARTRVRGTEAAGILCQNDCMGKRAVPAGLVPLIRFYPALPCRAFHVAPLRSWISVVPCISTPVGESASVLADFGLPFQFLPFDHLVAVTGLCFEFLAIHDVHASPGVLDQSCLL
jgi:hypothetical protein